LKSLLEYTDEELKEWIAKTRANRERIRSEGLEKHHVVKRETRAKVEKKARSQGIEVIEMDDILKGFLS